MQNQEPEVDPKGIRAGHFYRCRPTLYEAIIVGEYLVDLEGTNIQLFHLKDFTMHRRYSILGKQEMYCAQLAKLSDNILIVFGLNKFTVFDVEAMQVIETIKVNSYIEKVEAKNGFIIILASDEDSENKIVHCWRIDQKTGLVIVKHKATPFIPVEFEDCTEDNLCMTLIMSIDADPKVYIYWRGTNSMIEIDPIKQLSEQYNRQTAATFVIDLTKNTYAEIVDKKINVFHKNGGKKVAQLVSEGQIFTNLFCDGHSETIYSLSNCGLKRWKLQPNSTPIFYAYSDKYPVKKLFFKENETVIGINSETNNVVVWDNFEECNANLFPNETIRKVVKIDETRAFFLLEATANREEENEYHVTKYNKLEVYDFSKDLEIEKKAMFQQKYSVDADSVIVNDKDTIRFIVNEECENEIKKYILRWTPFIKDDNQKDIKKKEIKGAGSFDYVKLYHFNRILGLTKPKQSETFSLFGKENDQKTQVVLYDYSVKKFGDYDLKGSVVDVELSENNFLYTIGTERICIYSIDQSQKNRLQKINELEIEAISLKPYRDFLLIRKADTFLLLDSQFESVMREDVDKNDQKYKIIPYSKSGFLLKTELTLTMWNLEQQSCKSVAVPESEPNLIEYIDGKIIVADKWIEAYDVKYT